MYVKEGEYIPLDKCIDNGIYKVTGRIGNTLAIFSAETSRFRYLRTKFNNKFLDSQMHYDAHKHFGVVQPLEYLGQTTRPVTLEYLKELL